jgi:hypothetical protein
MKQNIAPITIKQFVSILAALKQLRENNKEFTHNKLEDLVRTVSESTTLASDSDEWIANTENIVEEWRTGLLAI